MSKPRRELLKEGREHLTVTNEFQSDKYPWCPAGFVPIKVTDPMAIDLLLIYAERRKTIDVEFTRDLKEALIRRKRTHCMEKVRDRPCFRKVSPSCGPWCWQHNKRICPTCDHRCSAIELENGSDGIIHCNHC